MEYSTLMLRSCTEEDLRSVRRIVDESESLTCHSTFTYWVALSEWPNLFIVARDDEEVVGFTFGLRNADHPDRVFLWQIGVPRAHRRRRIAETLLREFCSRAAAVGAQELWVTIEDENEASRVLFYKLALALSTEMVRRGSTGDLGKLLEPETIYSMKIST